MYLSVTSASLKATVHATLIFKGVINMAVDQWRLGEFEWVLREICSRARMVLYRCCREENVLRSKVLPTKSEEFAGHAASGKDLYAEPQF